MFVMRRETSALIQIRNWICSVTPSGASVRNQRGVPLWSTFICNWLLMWLTSDFRLQTLHCRTVTLKLFHDSKVKFPDCSEIHFPESKVCLFIEWVVWWMNVEWIIQPKHELMSNYSGIKFHDLGFDPTCLLQRLPTISNTKKVRVWRKPSFGTITHFFCAESVDMFP